MVTKRRPGKILPKGRFFGLLGRLAGQPRAAPRSRRLRIEPFEARTLLTAGLFGHDPAGERSSSILIVEPGPSPLVPSEAPLGPSAEFQTTSRWTTTAISGSGLGQGDATTLTWGFADDGTSIPGRDGDPEAPSDLVAFLDLHRGAGAGGSDLTQRPWFPLFAASFARISELTGITYVYEPNDDGAPFSTTARGVQGVRADVRIGGRFVDGESGTNTVAYNFFPNQGDMVIDTSNVTYFSSQAGNSVGFRNLVMHEHGHGLGIQHVESDDADFLMEPFATTAFDGPQLDEILALQREYGDALEKGSGNNSTVTATNLGELNNWQSISRGTLGNSTVVAASATDFLSIDDESDVDYFKFTIAASNTASITLTPRGATYLQAASGQTQTSFNAAAQSDLSLQVIDADGTTVLAAADATGVGGAEAITGLALPAAGTYFVRVSGATSNKVQLYGLTVSLASSSNLPGISVAVDPPGVMEDAGDVLRYTFTRTGDVAQPLTISLGISGTAAFGVDYSLSGASDFDGNTGSLVIPAGSATAQLTIHPTADNLLEDNETISITVLPGAEYEPASPSSALGTILNDEGLPTVTIAVANSPVSEDGTTNAIVTFSRTGDVSSSLAVNFSVSGLATLGKDYTQSGATSFTSTGGVVTIAAGKSTATITLDPRSDDIVEGDEDVTLALLLGSYRTGVPAAATAIIQDNDAAGAGYTNSVNSLFEDDGVLSVEVGLNIDLGLTVERASTFAVLITYLEADAADIEVLTSTITFPPGSDFFTIQTIRVDANSDSLVEGPQRFKLGLQRISGVLPVGSEPEQTITIDDSDEAEVSFETLETSVAEDGPSVNIRLRLHTAPGNTLEAAADIEVIASEETADASDFNAEEFPVFVTFGAGAADGATSSVVFDPRRDALVEPDETALLILFDGELLTWREPAIHTVIIQNSSPPEPGDGIFTTPEDTPVEIFLALGDISGELFSYEIETPPIHGTLSRQAPDILYRPLPNYHGQDAFVFRISNEFGESALGTMAITITPVNDQPAFTPTVLTLSEDGTVSLSLASIWSDVETPAALALFSLEASFPGVEASIDSIRGTLDIRGLADFFGSGQITIRGVDLGDAGSPPLFAETALQVSVLPVNDAPIPTSDALTSLVEGDPPRTIAAAALLANDLPGPANEAEQFLTVVEVGPAVGGTVSLFGTDIVFTPDADFFGQASFIYTVQDDGPSGGVPPANTATATVSFTIAEVNDAPLATPDVANVAEDSVASVIAVLANDARGPQNEADQTLTITAATALHGTVTIAADGTLRYTPPADYFGPDTIQYTIRDNGTTGGVSDPLTADGTVAITVSEVNDPPAAAADALPGMTEDGPARTVSLAELLNNDSAGPDNEISQSLSITAVSGAVGGTANLIAGGILFTPAANFSGPARFVYTLRDNGTSQGAADPKTATATVSFVVSEVNDAPTAALDTAVVLEDSSQQMIAVLANDLVGPANEAAQKLTVTQASALHGTVTIQADGSVAYRPDTDYFGPDTLTYSITDDGTTGGVADPKTTSGTVTITVREVNDAPLATPESAVVGEDASDELIDVLANDIAGPANESGQSLAVTAASALHGTVTITATGKLSYRPSPDYFGPDTITYTITDNGTTSGAADPKTTSSTVSIVVTEINDAPLGESDALADMAEDAPPRTIALAALLANDQTGPANEDGQTLTFVSLGTAIGGTVNLVGGEIVFTPTANYFGPARFSYTLRDNGTTGGDPAPLVATATVSFTITEVNDPPSAAPDVAIVAEDGLDAVVAVLANDFTGQSESGQTLNIVAASALHGDVTIAADGTLSYRPAPNYFGPDTISYTISDNGTTAGAADPLTAEATVAVTVTEVNDPPSAGDDSLPALLEDAAPLTISLASLLGNDQPGPSGEKEQTIAVTAAAAVAGGTISLLGSDLIFTPAADFFGQAAFTYSIRDDGTTSALADPKTSTATVTFEITAVNDAPSFVPGASQVRDDFESLVIVAGWAKSIAAGPNNELAQALSFEIVENTDSTLFEGSPVIDPTSGDLMFDPAPNRQGSATITIRLVDSGGTDHGGLDEVLQTFTITVDKPLRWHNSLLALDVAGNGQLPDNAVTASDPLTIINYINAFGPGSIPATPPPGFSQYGPPFLDTTADNAVTAADALEAINWINAFGSGQPGPPGQRPQSDTASFAAHDLLLSQATSPLPADRAEGEASRLADLHAEAILQLVFEQTSTSLRRNRRH